MFTLQVKSAGPIAPSNSAFTELSEAIAQAEESLFDNPEISSISVCEGDRVVAEIGRESNGKVDKALF